MHIYSKTTGALTPDTTKASQSVEAVDGNAVNAVPATPTTTDRSDKVQISDAGRALAARGKQQAEGALSASGGLDPAKADRIRSRILNGAYNTLDVVDTVARRLIGSGDL
jgi:negative regulator of flagellin synthesis FlgM